MMLLKKLFIFVLLSFLLGEIIRLDFGSEIFLKPVDIGVGITVLLWLVFKLVKKEKISQKRIYIPILFFAGAGFFSLLINYSSLTITHFFVSLMYLMRWVAYAGIFFVVIDFDKKFKKKINSLLAVAGSLIVGLGYVQYFFYPTLRNLIYLGWDEHMFRMFSIFLDPNFAGTFFVLFFLFLISRFLNKKSISVGLLSVLTLGAVFLTFSRSALIMLIISSSLLFILMNKKVWIISLLITTFIVLAISSKYFSVENINLFRIVSSVARLESAKNTILIIKNNPIFGVGFNSYRYAQLRYNIRSEKLGVVSHADAGTDNSFLFVMATTGLVGFILFAFLWFSIFKQQLTKPLLIASVVGVFVDSLFVNSLFYPFIMLWLWIILALSIKNHN